MMKIVYCKSLVTTILLVSIFAATSTVHAKVEVTFLEPKKFRDYEISGLSKKASIEQLKKQFEKLFTRLSTDKLDTDSKLLIQITDIDLAGHIDYFARNDMNTLRVVRQSDPYRLKFNYKVKDKAGNITLEGKENIKSFLNFRSYKLKHHQRNLEYLHRDIKNWMKEAL